MTGSVPEVLCRCLHLACESFVEQFRSRFEFQPTLQGCTHLHVVYSYWNLSKYSKWSLVLYDS